MKVLSKYIKVAFSFVAFLFAGLLFAVCPTTKTYALLTYTKSNYELAINAVQIKSKIAKNEEFTIPLLHDAFGEAKYTIRVTDPAGQVHDYVVGSTENDANYFELVGSKVKVKALTNGKYKVNYVLSKTSYDLQTVTAATFDAMKARLYTLESTTYTLLTDDAEYNNTTNYYTKEDRTYVSKTYDVEVDVPSYTIETATLVKTKVGKSTTAVEIPVAYVLDEDENRVQEASVDVEADIAVKFNGSNKAVVNRASLTDITEDDYFVKVGDAYYIVPRTVGNFTIDYSYNHADNVSYTVTVEEGFDAATTELSFGALTISSFELGDTVTLPKPTLNSSLIGDNVDYTLTKIRVENEDNANIYVELTDGLREFTLNPATFNHTDGTITYDDLKGNYKITYTVKDAYGNTKEETYRKTNISISASSAPSIYMAYNYADADVTNGTVKTDYAEDLKLSYQKDAIVLPAAYAEDKITAYGDLLIVRAIKNTTTGKVYYVDNYKVEKVDGVYTKVTELEDSQKNASTDANIGKVNKVVQFKFADSETSVYDDYKLVYEVYVNGTTALPERQNALYRVGSIEYTFKVVSTLETSTPEIEITNVEEEFTTGDEIEVKFTKKDSVDTRLKTAVYYYYTDGAVSAATIKTGLEAKIAEVIGDANYVIGNSNVLYDNNVYGALNYNLVQPEDGKYVVSLSEPTASKAVIVAVAINDNGNIAVDAKELTIKNTEESTIPTATISNLGDLKQDDSTVQEIRVNPGTVVTLPTVTFADTNDTTLTLNAYAYRDSIDNPVKIDYANAVDLNNIIAGGKITAGDPGIYYVVYTATDDAGNTVANFFSFIVNDTSKPVIEVKVSGEYTMSGIYYEVEQGESLTIKPEFFKADRTTKLDTALVTRTTNNAGNEFTREGNKYTFLDADATYTFTFSGSYVDEYANTRYANDVVITVKTKKPTLKIQDNIAVPTVGTKDQKVYLPVVTTDVESVCTPKVTLNSTTGTEVAVTLETYQGSTWWTFTPNVDNATYYVVYTATNAYASVSSKSYTVKIGDDVPPTITMSNKSALEKEITYDGENRIEIKYTIDTTNHTLKVKAIRTGNGEVIYDVDTGLTLADLDHKGNATSVQTLWNKLSVKLTSSDGTVTPGETNQYFVEGNGTYTLTIKTTDSNNNESNEYKVSFKLVSNTNVKEKNDTVIGVVLIVVSLVILAGVIAFFAFTGKKGGKAKSSKKSKANKTEEKETIVETEKVEEKVEEEAEEKADDTNENA